jgi:hypothetical protein
MPTFLASLVLAAGVSFGSPLGTTQDKPAPKADDEELTPEKAIELLKEVQGLMTRSEDLLNDSSRGKSVETEDAILKRINELLKDDPAATQKKTLEKIAKLMEKSEGSQKDAVERMAEILRKAKS